MRNYRYTRQGYLSVLALHPYLFSTDIPWVPTRKELLPHIMRLARIRDGAVFYDLGCGDGRVVIEAALHGAQGVCVEIKRELIEEAKRRARKAGVYERIVFVNDDFFNIDISDADIVYMYLLTKANRLLRPKLEAQLKIGARVITLDFEIPGWKPIHVEKHYVNGFNRSLYLYVKGVSDLI